MWDQSQEIVCWTVHNGEGIDDDDDDNDDDDDDDDEDGNDDDDDDNDDDDGNNDVDDDVADENQVRLEIREESWGEGFRLRLQLTPINE